MGERGQILIKETEIDTGIYLYSHWGGDHIRTILQNALAKKWRWDDTEYLARIIFEEMLGEERNTETGFGIGNHEHGDLNYPLLTIITDTKQVKEGEQVWSFEEFVALEHVE